MQWGLLAVDIDMLSIGTIFLTLIGSVGGFLGTIWIGFQKIATYLWAYAEPKITEAANAHTTLVQEMKSSVPVVASTMQTLARNQEELVLTQQQQCQTLERLQEAASRHEERQKKTDENIGIILKHITTK